MTLSLICDQQILHKVESVLIPSLPLPVKFLAWKLHTCTPANSIFAGPLSNLLWILCILIEILSRAHAKGAKKSLNDFKFGTIMGRFPSDGAASMAEKGLRDSEHALYGSSSAWPTGAGSDHWHTEPTEEETLSFPLQFDSSKGVIMKVSQWPVWKQVGLPLDWGAQCPAVGAGFPAGSTECKASCRSLWLRQGNYAKTRSRKRMLT